MTTFKKGDRVRRTHPHSRLEAGAEYTVSAYRQSPRRLSLVGREGWYSPANFELVPTATTNPEPPPLAEKGVFICVRLTDDGAPILEPFSGVHKHWVDAERDAANAAKHNPRMTFGVLKLIGTVSMQPTWAK